MISILWGHRTTQAAARWARCGFALGCVTLYRPMRLQGFVQKDLRYHRVNVFLAVQGLSNDQKRRAPPSSSSTRQKSPASSKRGTFTALHRNFCRETAHGRMSLPSVFPAAGLFPWPFLKGCSSWATGKGLCTMPCSILCGWRMGLGLASGTQLGHCCFLGIHNRRCCQSNRNMGTTAHQQEMLLQRDS